MVVLRRSLWASLGLMTLLACSRDFSTPWIATGPVDSTKTVVSVKPDSGKQVIKPGPVMIESIAAVDLRMNAGETQPAQVKVLPANATSPQYEMTSSNPGVAEVTADGIHGASAGTATITVHALDGSGKTTRFHVVVDAVLDICLLFPCLCKEQGKGKGKSKDCQD